MTAEPLRPVHARRVTRATVERLSSPVGVDSPRKQDTPRCGVSLFTLPALPRVAAPGPGGCSSPLAADEHRTELSMWSR